MSKHELKRKLDQAFERKEDKYLRVKGWLGNNQGTVQVPDREHYTYVTYETVSGATVAAEVFNVRTQYTPLLAVWVGFDPDEPSRAWQVLGERQSDGEETNTLGIGPHAETHRYLGSGPGGGLDWLPVELRQFMPFRVGPGGDLTISIYRGLYFDGTQWRLVEPASHTDLSSIVPSTSLKSLIVLVTLDDSGNIVTTAGSEFDSESFALTNIPVPPAGTKYIIGIVRLYEGQTEIAEGRMSTDIMDPRFPMWHTHSEGEISDIHDPVTLAADADAILGLSGQELNLDSQDANKFLAGPTSGAAADPVFRAIVADDIPSGGDDTAIHDNVTGEINAIAEKVSPVDADLVVIEDSAASYAKKKVQLSNLPGGGGGGHTIQDEGSSLTQRTNLNFTGAGVTATDDAGNDQTDVSIPSVTVKEQDGTPNVSGVIEIRVTNGTLTDEGSGVVSLVLTGGSGISTNTAAYASRPSP